MTETTSQPPLYNAIPNTYSDPSTKHAPPSFVDPLIDIPPFLNPKRGFMIVVICAGFFSIIAAFGYIISGIFFRSDWYFNMVAGGLSGGHVDAVASRRAINIFRGMAWLSYIFQAVGLCLLLTLVWLLSNDV